MISRYYWPVAFACAGLLAAHDGYTQAKPAAAAKDSGSLLEEVTVTAQRREQKLQDVPVAVSAFSAAQLERLNITQTLDLTRMVPNFVGHNNTGLGTANTYSLRGLNNTESIATFDAPVGTYVDDVFIARQNANNFAFFDMDRIEVLRGPQGVTFGRNTTGGAVNVILKEPGTKVGGFAEAGFGSWGLVKGRATIDLPVNDNVLTKLSAYYVKDDGYATNINNGERVNDQDNKGVRLGTKVIFSDKVSWNLGLSYVDDASANLGDYIDPSTGSRVFTTNMSKHVASFAGLITGEKQNYTLGNEVKTFMVTSNLKWAAPLGTVNFITGYYDLKQDYALDFLITNTIVPATGALARTPFPRGQFALANQGEHKEFTQEIKLSGSGFQGKLDYVTGLYYFDEKNHTDWADIVLGGVSADRTLENDTKAYAAYFQGDFHATDALTLTAGLRYTHEKKTLDLNSNNPTLLAATPSLQLNDANIAAAGIPLEQSVSLATPRLAAKYVVNPDLNFYASATRGFKSGGWNARSTRADLVTPFKPEKVWSYELGMRSDWLEKRLRFNATAFYLVADDYQLPSSFTPPGATAPSFVTTNPAKYENKGVELEIVAQPIEDLQVFLNAGYQDPKFKDLSATIANTQAACLAGIAGTGYQTFTQAQAIGQCAQSIVTPGGGIAQPVRAPKTTLTLGFSYTAHLASYNLVPSATLRQVGSYNVSTSEAPFAVTTVIGGRTYTNLTTTDHGGSLSDGYTTLDAGLTFGPADGPWSVQANCENCTNRTVINSALANALFIDAPRTWSVTGRYRF